MAKRPQDDEDGAVQDVNEGGGALVVSKRARIDNDDKKIVTADGIQRTSGLQAPTMQLTGHAGEVYTVSFSPNGEFLASGSFDKSVFLWQVYGDCQNYSVLKGHKNAVLEVHWLPSGEQVTSCSADRTVRVWDANVGSQIKKYKEHTGVVNGVAPLQRGAQLLASASDDCTARVFDLRAKRSVATFPHKFQVTCVTFSKDGDELYTGGLDNTIKVWDLRTGAVNITLKGHSDTVTGISLSPDGSHLLSNSMDNTLRVWDMRPYAPANRCVRMMTGHMHNFEKLLLRCSWNADSSLASCGSADRMVYVWNANSCSLQYKLPGHSGSVNQVIFHPKEPIVASASSDRNIFMGELMR